VSVAITQYKNYVGGEWVESSSGETMPVLNPATGETIAEVPRGTEEDVSRAIAAARKALPDWRSRT
jgi:acyl-CoA reductase-like NAD-dependent aldehyde dehydrogenase